MPKLENGDFVLNNVRLSFPTLIEPKGYQGGPEKFSATFIMNDKDEDYIKFMQYMSEQLQSTFKEKASGVFESIKESKLKRCFGKGSEKRNSEGEVYEGYQGEGTVFISAKSDNKPQLIGTNAKPVLDSEANQLFVGGNYVNALIRPWVQNNAYGSGIRATLIAVQYVKEGDHFGSAPVDATHVFAPVEGAGTSSAFDMLS
jgi:hypothetical protein